MRLTPCRRPPSPPAAAEPFENDGSFAPIDANGNFDYVNWWANDVYDVVTPAIFGFVWPNAAGNCVPTMGGPAIPAEMFTGSAVWIQNPRINTIALAVDPPAPNVDESLDVVITGIPAGVAGGSYKALVYAHTASGLVGPLPTCASVHDVIADPNNPAGAQVHVRNWSTGHANLVQDADAFTVALIPTPWTPDAGSCLNGAAAIPVAAPVIVDATAARVPPPSATPSPSASSSAAPSIPASLATPSPDAGSVDARDTNATASGAVGSTTRESLVIAVVVAFCVVAFTVVLG